MIKFILIAWLICAIGWGINFFRVCDIDQRIEEREQYQLPQEDETIKIREHYYINAIKFAVGMLLFAVLTWLF